MQKIIYQGKTEKGKRIIIRYPVKDDLLQIWKFINALSKEKTFIRFQGEEIPLKEEKEYLNKLLKNIKTKKSIQLSVYSNNQLIGSSTLELQDKIERHVGIFGITIAKDFRGQGIGKLLMELTVKEAQKNLPGLKIIKLGVFANNPKALEMYKNFGFLEYGRLPKGIITGNNELIDHVYMYKNID